MAQAPKADVPRCDVPGCGSLADLSTDGTEKDSGVRRVSQGVDEPLNRKSIPYLNLCNHHLGWAFSDDAKSFTTAGDSAGRYQARTLAASKGK